MKHICTKFVAMLLVIAMIAGVLPFAFAANVGPFTDVKDTDWFASNVQYVYDNGLMNGTTTTTFEPESNLTRAQTAICAQAAQVFTTSCCHAAAIGFRIGFDALGIAAANFSANFARQLTLLSGFQFGDQSIHTVKKHGQIVH